MTRAVVPRPHFTGPFGPALRQHLAVRRALGFALRNAEFELAHFDHYVAKAWPAATTVTRAMVEDYFRTLSHLASGSRAIRLSHLRQFCRFLLADDPTTYLPERAFLPPATSVIHPYIYSPEDVRAILQAARRLPPAGSLRPVMYATLIGLLAVSGLRCGEALRLDLVDVDLRAERLCVRTSKFRKSRLVPITGSTAMALQDYLLQRRRAGCAEHPTSPFFINQRGRRCDGYTVDYTYRTLLRGLPLITAQGRTPRLHDFRHTFATTCAAHIASDRTSSGGSAEMDPTAGLAGLATYLGHSHFAHTQRYFHPQATTLETASARFRQHTLAASSSGGPDATR